MKNDFCDLDQDEIYAMNVPDKLKGLLASPFQHNKRGENGEYVLIPSDTFKEFVDVTALYLQSLHKGELILPP